MSFETNEKQTQQSTSAELYTITVDKRIYRYTSYDRDVAYDGWTYAHIPITRSEISFGSASTDFGQCEITLPIAYIDMARINYDPPTIFSVVIRQMHTDTGQSLLLLDAIVRGVNASKSSVSLSVQSVFSRISESIPRGYCQAGCNNSLYDSVCGLTRAAYNMLVEVVDVAVYVQNANEKYYSLYTPPFYGRQVIKYGKIDVVPIRPKPGVTNTFLPQYEITYRDVCANSFGLFLSDYADITGEVDYAVNGKTYLMSKHVQASNKFYATPMLPGLNIGEILTVRPGCDRSVAVCITRFGNSEHFVGMPYIPRLNVTGGVSVQLY